MVPVSAIFHRSAPSSSAGCMTHYDELISVQCDARIGYVTAVAPVLRRDAIHEYQSTLPKSPLSVSCWDSTRPPTYGKSVLVNW